MHSEKSRIILIAFALLACLVYGCSDTPEPDAPAVSIIVEALGEPDQAQASMVEDRFIHMLNQNLAGAFFVSREIGIGDVTIRGAIERIHGAAPRLAVDLVIEAHGKREPLYQEYDLERPSMRQLAIQLREKLERLSAVSALPSPNARARKRPVVIHANHPGMLEIFADDQLVERTRFPGSNIPLSLLLDGTRGYRFIAIPSDTIAYRRWESASDNYWPPNDTISVAF